MFENGFSHCLLILLCMCIRPIVECEPGFFGAGCEQPCDCPGGGSCDPRTGECSQRCPAGLHGDKCQLGETKTCFNTFCIKLYMFCRVRLKRNLPVSSLDM